MILNSLKSPLILVYLLALNLPSVAQESSSRSVSVSGDVTFTIPDSDTYEILAANQELKTGYSVKTGKNGEAILGLMQGVAVTLKAETIIKITELKTSLGSDTDMLQKIGQVELIQGRIVVLISKDQADAIDFSIKTPEGIAKPRGTFYVIMVRNEKTFIAVKDGKVGLEQFQPLDASSFVTEDPTTDSSDSKRRTTTTSPRG